MIGTILGLIGAAGTIITIFYLARTNAREQQRAREADRAKAIEDAERPLKDRILLQDETIRQLQRAVEAKDGRITQLEDRLYGRPH